MRKVFYILGLQLLVTALIAGSIFAVPVVTKFFIQNVLIAIICSVVSLIAFFVLVCCEKVARRFPINIILLGLFTVCEGVLLGYTCLSSPTHGVIVSIMATVVLVFGLGAFALTTKMDFTGCGIYLLAAALAVFSISIVIIICEMYFNIRLTLAHKIMSMVFLVLFSLYLVFDIQIVQGGDDRQACLGVDDYVFGCLTIYIDIISIFLYFLRIFE
eukprot:GHVR01092504.1.p1 GENE.GHVR01092504.1~~GHVR01092504.1.p1  ORF type:complete len:215 (+),score=2.97 GHVR01092504.1:224-868(+)